MKEATDKQTASDEAVSSSVGLAVGDLVKYGPNSYEVAEIRMFPHGPMVGIYDEPPSKHVDFLNPTSVSLAARARHGHLWTCLYLNGGNHCDCMTDDERRRYLAWLNAAANTEAQA